jgi:hypothetical protein
MRTVAPETEIVVAKEDERSPGIMSSFVLLRQTFGTNPPWAKCRGIVERQLMSTCETRSFPLDSVFRRKIDAASKEFGCLDELNRSIAGSAK